VTSTVLRRDAEETSRRMAVTSTVTLHCQRHELFSSKSPIIKEMKKVRRKRCNPPSGQQLGPLSCDATASLLLDLIFVAVNTRFYTISTKKFRGYIYPRAPRHTMTVLEAFLTANQSENQWRCAQGALSTDGESTVCGMSPNTGNRSPCALSLLMNSEFCS
jgi:hypothetical protein